MQAAPARPANIKTMDMSIYGAFDLYRALNAKITGVAKRSPC